MAKRPKKQPKYVAEVAVTLDGDVTDNVLEQAIEDAVTRGLPDWKLQFGGASLVRVKVRRIGRD